MMKRLVLGISIIFCLQLGFIAYTAIDNPIETLPVVNDDAHDSMSLTNAPAISDYDEFWKADENDPNRKEITLSKSLRRTSKRSSGTIQASSKKFIRNPVSRQIIFEPVVIAIKKSPEIKFRTEYPHSASTAREFKNRISSRSIPRAEKKSFFTKSVSVLKKPYDWLKAVASRIK